MWDNILLLVRGGWVPFLSGCELWFVLLIENPEVFPLQSGCWYCLAHNVRKDYLCLPTIVKPFRTALWKKDWNVSYSFEEGQKGVSCDLWSCENEQAFGAKYLTNFICTQIVPSPLPGTEGAAKKWRGLINIHDLDCCSPSRHLYHVARILNQLRHGHRAWPMF